MTIEICRRSGWANEEDSAPPAPAVSEGVGFRDVFADAMRGGGSVDAPERGRGGRSSVADGGKYEARESVAN